MSAVDTSLGFKFEYRMCGAPPTVLDILCSDTETLTKGDMANWDASELDLMATGDTAALGQILETAAGTDSTTKFNVITNGDAVYSVYDANARLNGATLDIAGATGNQTIASSSNKEFVVVANSSAAQRTFVRWNVGVHMENVAL